VLVHRPAALVEVDVGQRRVVRAARRDHHVVDRSRQAAEEPVQGVRVGRVERRGRPRSDVGPRGGQALRVAAGDDDLGALGAGAPGGFESDAGTAADHEDGLAGQLRFAWRGFGGHGSYDRGRGGSWR
jgi:hypothetical protein